jgi:hypothetical protein
LVPYVQISLRATKKGIVGVQRNLPEIHICRGGWLWTLNVLISASSTVKGTGSSRRELLGRAIALGGVAAAIGPSLVGGAVAGNKKDRKHRKMLPPSNVFDLRGRVGPNTNNYISSVKDQGVCNSCTAFAVIAAIEGSYSFQKHQPITNPSNEPAFSESRLFFCNVSDGCGVTAWFPEDALDACLNTGVTDRANNPYDPANPNGIELLMYGSALSISGLSRASSSVPSRSKRRASTP